MVDRGKNCDNNIALQQPNGIIRTKNILYFQTENENPVSLDSSLFSQLFTSYPISSLRLYST
jgi:hypothetical protein